MDNISTERREIVIDEEAHSHNTAEPAHVGETLTSPAEPQTSGDTSVQRHSSRLHRRLMVGTSIGVVVLAAAGVFAISPYGQGMLAGAGRAASHAGQVAFNMPPQPAPRMAPAARLAHAPEPSRAMALPSHPDPGDGDDMAQFLKLRNDAATQSKAPPLPEIQTLQRSTSSATPSVVGQQDASPRPTNTQIAQHEPNRLDAQLPSPQPVPRQPVVPGSPAVARVPMQAMTVETAKPVDAAQALAQLRAAPMTPQDQVDVLQLVTQLGALVRDERVQIEELRKTQAGSQQTVDRNIADFCRRLILVEARGSMAAAMGAPVRPATMEPDAASNYSQSAGAVVIQVAARTGMREARDDEAPHRYRLQAASPGLAMLSELDTSGGEEREVTVQPGDNLPGYGRVASVSQRGTVWVIKAERGLIQ